MKRTHIRQLLGVLGRIANALERANAVALGQDITFSPTTRHAALQDPPPTRSCNAPGCLKPASFEDSSTTWWCDEHSAKLTRLAGLHARMETLGPTQNRTEQSTQLRVELGL